MWYINTVFKIGIFLYKLIGSILSAKSGNMQCCVFEMQDALKGVLDFIGCVFEWSFRFHRICFEQNIFLKINCSTCQLTFSFANITTEMKGRPNIPS